jgi:AcrR family transcriptional regulator
MIGKVAERREARTQQILACAWELARTEGVAGFSLHALARAVGIRQPSLYEYFASKDALYDAMFADGNRRLHDRLDAVKLPTDPRAALKKMLRAFVDFALEDPARCELIFQRHIPGFTPSTDSYALAEQAMVRVRVAMQRADVTATGDVDCLVAITGGVIEAQLSNEPDTKRWTRHLERLIDMYLDDMHRRSTK